MRARRSSRTSRSARLPNVRRQAPLRAKPPDDEMHAYNTKDLERLFGLPASAVRSLTRAGHINPVKRGGRLHYSFQDLLMLRTASALRSASISAQRINRTLQTLRSTLPAGASLDQRSLTALGNQIAVREGKVLWESESGQYVLALDIGEARGGLHVITRQPPSPPPGDSADDHYARAFVLEDKDAERIYRGSQQQEPLLAFNLAVLLEDLNREPDAIVAYREALALDPQLADAHFNLARLYERARNPKASLRHLLAYRRMIDQQGT